MYSKPQGAKVYFVPLYDWENNKNLTTDDQQLAEYFVVEGPTPVKTKVYEQVYMVVFELSGRKHSIKVDVMKSKQNTVLIDLK